MDRYEWLDFYCYCFSFLFFFFFFFFIFFLKAKIVIMRIKNSGIGKLRFFTFYYDMKDVKN